MNGITVMSRIPFAYDIAFASIKVSEPRSQAASLTNEFLAILRIHLHRKAAEKIRLRLDVNTLVRTAPVIRNGMV